MNENMNAANRAVPAKEYRPKLALYHPNQKGTGCALKLELHPAHGDVDGCIMACLAQQKTVGSMQGGIKVFPTFDWEKRICIKLDFADLCRMLQVFRGECEAIEDGKGLYHRSAQCTTRIVLRHILEPVQAYSLEVYQDRIGHPDENKSAHIVLNTYEAMGITLCIENSIGVICFGVPRVTPRASVEGGTDEAVA